MDYQVIKKNERRLTRCRSIVQYQQQLKCAPDGYINLVTIVRANIIKSKMPASALFHAHRYRSRFLKALNATITKTKNEENLRKKINTKRHTAGTALGIRRSIVIEKNVAYIVNAKKID